MQKNLIIIGGGALQVPLIETAYSMGLHPIVFDMSSDAVGMRLKYVEPVIMSTRDIEGCVRTAKTLRDTRPIHGVVTAGTDASRAVSAIAAALDLPGIRYTDAEAASNKVMMRKRLRAHNIPAPSFRAVWSLKEAREAMDDLEFPLVLKPAENMGARGVIKISGRDEMQAAYAHTRRFSPTGEMILEEFMDGPELSVDALAFDGEVRITGIADRIIAREPYFIELGHNMPSSLPGEILEEAEAVMKGGMRALGIHTGAGKGDLKVTKSGVKVGEIAARLSGGFMSSHTYPLHSGVNLLRAAIQIALGERPDDLEPKWNRCAIERGIIGTPGKILTISGAGEMKRVAHIAEVCLTRRADDIIPQPTSNIDKCGHVIACAPSLDEAERAVSEAMERFELIVDDTFSVEWKRVEERARLRFGSPVCHVCKSCDGENCASGVPGMGGVGRMTSFRDNVRALEEIKIVPKYIRKHTPADTTIELFGRKFEHPIFAAPMTGTVTNMNGALDEYDFTRILLQAGREAGGIAFVGDGASPERYRTILRALGDTDGFGILICKPREDRTALRERFRLASEMPLAAVGMDIDAITIRTMEMKNLNGSSFDADELRRIRDGIRIPFILKGIVSVEDADQALRAGVDAIVVSNHGGRILDDMPGTARILPEIVRHVNRRIPVLVDGGIRSGMDAFKMIALGADAVLVGRPLAIAAVGGEVPGVKYLITRYAEELKKAMNVTGARTIRDIDSDYIFRTDQPGRMVKS
jgi:isopentenyl diphosphate isomerase/L-lactate dehydrogenase-like FMN-dependent dehydrogenase/biotin carboxylase